MEIVKLNEEYLKLITEENNKYPQKGIGVKIYVDETFFFVPITSQDKKGINKQDEKKFFSLEKNGTLLICDYIYIKPFLVEKIKENATIISEIKKLQDNKSEILKNLRFQINYSKDRIDKRKKELLEGYTRDFTEKNRQKAIEYTKNAIDSMSILEKINFSSEEIEQIIKYQVFEKVDLYDVKTIFNLIEAWKFLKNTLESPLTLDYIIHINRLIANHQALKVGELRDGNNSVSGEFFIVPPNKEKVIKFMEKILGNKNIQIEAKALLIFHKLITEQWFWDGNKRTAFIIANKLLIKEGKGIFLLDSSTSDSFSQLLYNCYKNKDKRNELFKFIQEKCIKIWG